MVELYVTALGGPGTLLIIDELASISLFSLLSSLYLSSLLSSLSSLEARHASAAACHVQIFPPDFLQLDVPLFSRVLLIRFDRIT